MKHFIKISILTLFTITFLNSKDITTEDKNILLDNPNLIDERYKENENSNSYEKEPPKIKENKKLKENNIELNYNIDIDRETGELKEYELDIKKKF